MQLSTVMGFSRFHFVKKVNMPPEQARDHKTGDPKEFLPWSKNKQFNTHISNEDALNAVVHKEKCIHHAVPSVFLSSAGILAPCCYLETVKLEDFKGRVYKQCFRVCGSVPT